MFVLLLCCCCVVVVLSVDELDEHSALRVASALANDSTLQALLICGGFVVVCLRCALFVALFVVCLFVCFVREPWQGPARGCLVFSVVPVLLCCST